MIDGWTMANGVRNNKSHGTAKAVLLRIAKSLSGFRERIVV